MPLVHIALIFAANSLTKGVGQIGLRARAVGLRHSCRSMALYLPTIRRRKPSSLGDRVCRDGDQEGLRCPVIQQREL